MTVQLDDQSSQRLREIAAAENRSEAEVVRDLVLQYKKRRPLPIGMGKYRSGQSDTSENAGKIIKEAGRNGDCP